MITGNQWSLLFQRFPGLSAAVLCYDLENEYRALRAEKPVDRRRVVWVAARLADLEEYIADYALDNNGERPIWAIRAEEVCHDQSA